MNTWINLHALWKIVVLGLVAGAGLPALFAVGLRALSTGPRTSVGDGEAVYGGNVYGLIAATLCFAIVLAAIGLGIYSIVSGS
jgi:hypothetical protein